MISYISVMFDAHRDSIGAQLQLALAKSDSEQLARTIAAEQLSEAEKEKTMKELELREAVASHKNEMAKKEHAISNVSGLLWDIYRLYYIDTCLCRLTERMQMMLLLYDLRLKPHMA